MAYVRKLKASLVQLDSSEYVGEESYLFYDIETACIRITDGTPGGRPACIEGSAGSVVWGGVLGTITDQTDLIALMDTYVSDTEKGAINGVATLDSSGLIPISQLPSPYAPQTQNNVTTLVTMDSAVATVGKWIVKVVEAATPANVYSTEIVATHNGTLVDSAKYGILTLGSAITGLNITVTLTGGNTLNLNVESTAAVNVIAHRVMVA